MKLFGFVVLSVLLASISTLPLDSTETDLNEHIDDGWMHDLTVEEGALRVEEDNGIIDIWNKIKKIWAWIVAHAMDIAVKVILLVKSIVDQFLPEIMKLVKDIGALTKQTLKDIDQACKADPSGCIAEVRNKIMLYEVRVGVMLFTFGRDLYAKVQKILADLVARLVKTIVDIINKLIHKDDVAFIHKELANNNIWEAIKEVLQKVGDAIVHFGDEMFKKLAVFGPKIIASLKKIVEKISAQFNEFIKKYKDLIIDALKKDAAVIIVEVRKILVSAVDGLVKIIVDAIKHLITDEELGIKKYLEISLEDSGLADVDSKISDWFKKVWAKIKEFFKAFGDEFQKFDDMVFHAVQKWMIKTREMRAIISAILKEYVKQALGYLEVFVNKYKDIILNELKKDAKVLIAEFRTLATALVDNIVKIIIDAIKHLVTKDGPMEKLNLDVSPNSFWDKILDTVKKIKGVIKESTLKTLEKYKPEILDAVKNLKDVIIACGKDIVVQVSHGIVKVIVDGWTVMSDDSNPEEFYFKGQYDMIILPEKTA